MNIKDLLKNRFFFNTLLIIALFFAAFWAILLSFKLREALVKHRALTFDPAQVVPTKEGSEAYKNILSVVFLGQGGEGHSGGTLTDSIIILAADTQDKRAALISVPRDLWVPIPYDWESTRNFKVNAAYLVGLDNTRYANKKPEFKGEEGAGNMVKYVLENITGLPISYFVAIDFSSYEDLIDGLGGVEVNVPKTFSDPYYPIKGLENETCGISGEEIAKFHELYSGFDLEKQFPCRWEKVQYEKGPTKLTGSEALKFVRSRHGDSDFGRSERQFAVLLGIEKKLLSLGALTKGFNVVENLVDIVKTDMNLATIKQLIGVLGNVDQYEITEIHITEDNLVNASKSTDGQFILVPKNGNNNFEGIKNYIRGKI